MSRHARGYRSGMSDSDFRDPEPLPEGVPEDDADFASEHSDTTVADHLSGGPEGAKDPDSPHGRSGLD